MSYTGVDKKTYDKACGMLFVDMNGKPAVPMTSFQRQIVQQVKHSNDPVQIRPNPYSGPVDHSVKANIALNGILKTSKK